MWSTSLWLIIRKLSPLTNGNVWKSRISTLCSYNTGFTILLHLSVVYAMYYHHITMRFFNRGLSTYHHQDHRALDDVLVTVSLWFHLKKRLDILHNSPGPSAYIHQKLLHLKKKGSTCIVDTSHHTYTSRDQSVRVMNSKITFYALISSMTAQEVQKLLFM